MVKELVIQGDCLDVLKTFEDNSIDAVVTDPPYGLSKEPDINEVLAKWMAGEPYDHGHGGFMGKLWDSFVMNTKTYATSSTIKKRTIPFGITKSLQKSVTSHLNPSN